MKILKKVESSFLVKSLLQKRVQETLNEALIFKIFFVTFNTCNYTPSNTHPSKSTYSEKIPSVPLASFWTFLKISIKQNNKKNASVNFSFSKM